MATSDESFLPQIVGLFYAAFDPKLGPTVLYQVPENLITHSSRGGDEARSRSVSRSRAPDDDTGQNGPRGREVSRGRAFERTSTWSSTGSGSRIHSLPRSASPTGPTLLDFAPISDYVIPKKSLYGRLVMLLTTGKDNGEDESAEYRIMGFPSLLTGEGGRYSRNEYMWNLCFVFHGSSSLEAFEPVVRKCGRILRSAELDSAYLSSPGPHHTPLPAVLEQLFEDLNSYSETSIPLDGFNSLELKLFPYFPNPPDVHECHVPIPLVDLDAFRDDNWDITASRVAQHIDGVNHVRRIAELADADLALTKETLRHMLFYQVVMMIDLFQYSNMYTLKPSISRLASDDTVISECAAYVTRSGYSKPTWPTLLRLYSYLVPGLTMHEWIEKHDVLALGIDPRRFVSFGIIKGFLRRVHRWPIIQETKTPETTSKRKVEFDKVPRVTSSLTSNTRPEARSGGDSTYTLRSMGSHTSLGVSPSRTSIYTKSPSRRIHQGFTNVKDSFPSISTEPVSRKRNGALKLKEQQDRQLEDDLIKLLDGTHHTDEIQVRFGMSWKELERAMRLNERKDAVVIVYR